MDLAAILKKIGASIVKAEQGENVVTMTIRLNLADEMTRVRWQNFIEQSLLKERDDKRSLWTLDIGQVYFLKGNVPVYLWRLIVSHRGKKGLARAIECLRDATIESARVGVEVTSFPLVGRHHYAGSQTRGAHRISSSGASQAGMLISKASMG